MKFSNETLAILKNFSSINTNIIFKPGDTLATISNAKNIFAKATIKETIPNEFAIYDLTPFLQCSHLWKIKKLSLAIKASQ